MVYMLVSLFFLNFNLVKPYSLSCEDFVEIARKFFFLGGGGIGSGTIGKVVASISRGLRFNSSHQHLFIKNIYFLITVEKTKIKKKRQFLLDT